MRLLHQVQHAQAVNQPVVVSPRIGQVADAELVNAAQSLNLRSVQKVQEHLSPPRSMLT